MLSPRSNILTAVNESDCRGISVTNFYHQVFLADPAVGGELLQHGHKVLDAAVPVTQQENHHEQRQDAEEEADHLQVCVRHLSRKHVARYLFYTLCAILQQLTGFESVLGSFTSSPKIRISLVFSTVNQYAFSLA